MMDWSSVSEILVPMLILGAITYWWAVRREERLLRGSKAQPPCPYCGYQPIAWGDAVRHLLGHYEEG